MEVLRLDLDDNLELLEISVKSVAALIEADVVAVDDLEIELHFLREKSKIVIRMIDKLIPMLRTANLTFEAQLQLQRKMEIIKNMAILERMCAKILEPPPEDDNGSPKSAVDSHRLLTLPKRELPKFDGDVRNWLAFWGAFQKIHSDRGLSESEKFHYLLQSTVYDSPAYKVVNSSPASGPNYQAAVKSLTERFGRKKTLIKVYVRDLLKIVVDNSKQDNSIDFIDLVNSIDSQIRNLHQLGVTVDTHGELLYPVVESCIPEEVLDGYLRAPNYKEELEDLLQYLQNEVRRRMETSLAQTQFKNDEEKKKYANSFPNHAKNRSSFNKARNPMTAGFMNMSGHNEKRKGECVFCKKGSHGPTECRIAAT